MWRLSRRSARNNWRRCCLPCCCGNLRRAYSSKCRASLLNFRMPSASLSVAMASSLCIQRKVFSSRCRRSSLARLRLRGIELAFQSALGFFQLVQQLGTDGEQVASGQALDLIHVAETRSHYLGLVAVLLVVVINAGYGRDPGILVGGNLLAAAFLLVPIVNTSDKGRNQGHLRLRRRPPLERS